MKWRKSDFDFSFLYIDNVAYASRIRRAQYIVFFKALIMSSIKQWLFILFTIFILSAGQVLFKVASVKLDLSYKGLVTGLLFNPVLILAVALYTVATVFWLFILKSMPLNVAYPLTALGFFIVPLLSFFFLGEPLRWTSFVGAGIIMLGVYVSTL
jgi:multidrug transporter EmrE-like cation transporter